MRTKFIKFLGIAIVMLAVCSTAMLAQSAPPSLFFSDLESGPNTGGQNNKGVWVTIWGKGFGATQGTSTVTVGGARWIITFVVDAKSHFSLAPVLQAAALW